MKFLFVKPAVILIITQEEYAIISVISRFKHFCFLIPTKINTVLSTYIFYQFGVSLMMQQYVVLV